MNPRALAYRALSAGRWLLRNPKVLRIRQLLGESQWWTPDQLREFQNKSLNALMQYVHKHVPYYRKVMKERGLKPHNIQTVDDLAKFPILDKETFREHWYELISDEVNPKTVKVRQTGGTTGEPLRIAYDPLNTAYELEAFRRGLGFSGYRQGEKIVKLFGGSLGLAPESKWGKIKARLSGEIFLPAFELSRQNVKQYVDVVQKVRFLRGYASAVYLLAMLMEEAGLRLRLQAVFPTAEILYDHWRELIVERLGPVFEYYGGGELNSIAFECECHQGLHIAEEHVFLEILREEEKVPDGEMGAVTLTTLQNYTMPLIRYQNGDVAVLDSKPCACGRGLMKLSKILGRTNDLLRAKDGRLISGAFIPHLFRVSRGIQQVQVVQETEDLILVKVVKGQEFSGEELETTIEAMRRYLGEVMIEVEYVDSIPRTVSGKIRFVICKVDTL